MDLFDFFEGGLELIGYHPIEAHNTPVKMAPELREITFSTGKPKLTPGEIPTFQGFYYTYK